MSVVILCEISETPDRFTIQFSLFFQPITFLAKTKGTVKQGVVQEAGKNQVRTFMHFNNFPFTPVQLNS